VWAKEPLSDGGSQAPKSGPSHSVKPQPRLEERGQSRPRDRALRHFRHVNFVNLSEKRFFRAKDAFHESGLRNSVPALSRPEALNVNRSGCNPETTRRRERDRRAVEPYHSLSLLPPVSRLRLLVNNLLSLHKGSIS
jgi:hypothetical protein